MGTFAISGSVATRLRNRVMACAPSSQVGVHVHVDQVGPVLHLVARDVDRRLEVAGLDQARRTASSR